MTLPTTKYKDLGPVKPLVTVLGIGSRERDRMHTVIINARIRHKIYQKLLSYHVHGFKLAATLTMTTS